ncbi:hypothetical protein CUMW_200600 [Citrus unshiu]|uniref:Phytocyanin domain-containing protein n=1 Tax=Citrus unshiu TaxID=55188 RepID=A0A2H5Q6M0_CITUN|nr:hypothetical protein CUMW_200600 [Citrus unshiu]
MHDVHEVTEADYVACNAKASIKHHISGSDAITLNAPGIYYFICGIPGHCQAGQRLRIEVESDGSPGASPSAAPGQSPTTSSTSTGGSASTVPPGGGSGSTPPSSSSALLPYSLHTFEVMLSNYWNPNTLCPMFQEYSARSQMHPPRGHSGTRTPARSIRPFLLKVEGERPSLLLGA